MRFVALFALVACSPVYDAQYDDRRLELEEARTEFLPAEVNVKLITGAQDKLYWVDVEKPLDQPVLHSFVPSTNVRTDYGAWTNTVFTGQPADISSDFVFGSSLIVDCAFGVRAYDAVDPDRGMIAEENGFRCAVDGDAVYYVVGRDMMKWLPRSGAAPAVLLNFDAAGVGEASIGALGVIGDLALVDEGGDLWVIDLVTKQGTWLMNENRSTGAGFFDPNGVLYDTQDGLTYTSFAADHSTFSFESAVADGGYRLNGHYSDAEEVGDFTEFVISGKHVIYRARNGIFAYDLESKKVIDILLDGLFDDSTFEKSPNYRSPVVTIDDTLFVMNDSNGFGTGDNQVYRVDLVERFR